MMTWMWMMAMAWGGYGDAVGGQPTHAQREVHFWTNAVRVDPAAFSSEYPCSFSFFSNSESTPKWPLYWDSGLGEAADYHSADMDADGYFDHDSNDGTSWDERIYRYYNGNAIGENIAWGYTSPYAAVVEGWMCSGGHRANIMSTNYNEMGTGVSDTYYTQDFGSGTAESRAMAMGIHLPKNPGNTVQFGVDWVFETAPDALFVVLNGDRIDLEPWLGDPDGWSAWTTEATPASGCNEYYFVGQAQGSEQTFPANGSYGWGVCPFADGAAGWMDSQLPWEDEAPTDPTTDDGDPTPAGDDDDDDDDPSSHDGDDDDTSWYDGDGDDDQEDTGAGPQVAGPAAGCSTLGGAPSAGGLILAVFAFIRRRRQTPPMRPHAG